MITLYCVVVGVAGSAFPVDIDENKSVGHLKDAIKEKKPDTITCEADKLQLFLTKKEGGGWLVSDSPDVISMRSGTIPEQVDELLHEQIDPAEEVGELFGGAPTKKVIHVLVVVPKQWTSVPIASQDGVFAHCSDPFFSQLPTADERGGWLEFPALLPLTECQQLYIRSSYKSIAAQALSKMDPNRRKYAVITGTPGIGKSVFVYYVMWRLIKDQKRVLFLTAEPPVYFDGECMFVYRQLPFAGNFQFWSPDLWCCVDSVDPTTIAGFPVLNCSTLLASTPRQDCIGDFKKLVPTPDVYYMPLWTEEELARITPLYPDAAPVWQNRMTCLGGVPRQVLQDIQTDPQSLLESACRICSLDDCIMLLSINSEINSKTKIAQTLIHIRSEKPYRTYSVGYASELAMKIVAQTKWQTDRTRMQNLLGACDGHPLTQALCGYIFESHAMDLLERGGSFVYRELLSYPEMKRRNIAKRQRADSEADAYQYIDIPASPIGRQTVERVERNQTSNQLYVPRTSNYASIDAWMPNKGAFQMTVGKKHAIRGGAADDLAKLGEGGNCLYFLLPPHYYETFTKKTPKTIKQFAILIPYPEEVQ
ncbi:hypothetical protein PC123_g26383 [Phytophthora cactorum]|nr:hypothetical protein PC123_g26383 [Phytophthora cactorum]